MPRAIWSGAISFGLVNVPVKLYTATEEKDIRFHQFQEKTGQRIRNKRVAEKSGREVDYDDIVKGYEFDKGKYVMVEPDELEAIAPEKTRAVEIESFVDLESIDPVYFQTTYYLAPDGHAARAAYALLRDAMEEAKKIAIGRFVLRTKEYLAAVRPVGGILAIETMFFPDEVRSPSALDITPPKSKPKERELKIALQLVDSLSTEWDPERYRDTYRERVLDLIERKAKGEEVVLEEPAEEPAKVVDLLAALEASVNEARQRRGDGASAEPKPTKAKKATKKAKAKPKKARSGVRKAS